jgi:hypothetical protein
LDTLADELLAAELAPTAFDWERWLTELAEIRGRMRGSDDAVALVRKGREELEQRGL